MPTTKKILIIKIILMMMCRITKISKFLLLLLKNMNRTNTGFKFDFGD
jgi:hypothetical protein